MAEQKELPQIVGKTHERFKTPYVSLLLTSIAMFVLTVQSSFISALTIATITRLIVYATTCAALPVFRRKTEVPAARFRAPFGNIAAILSVLLTVWLLTNVDFRKEGLAILIASLTGFVIYAIYQFYKKRFS